MRDSTFKRRLALVEAAARAIHNPNEPSPERKAELHRHMQALTVNEQLEVLHILDKRKVGTLSTDDCARFSVLWSKADLQPRG